MKAARIDNVDSWFTHGQFDCCLLRWAQKQTCVYVPDQKFNNIIYTESLNIFLNYMFEIALLKKTIKKKKK